MIRKKLQLLDKQTIKIFTVCIKHENQYVKEFNKQTENLDHPNAKKLNNNIKRNTLRKCNNLDSDHDDLEIYTMK